MGVNNLFHRPLHFEFYVLFILFNNTFDQYLNYRQYRFIKKNLTGDKNFFDETKKHDKSYKKTLESLKPYLFSDEYQKTLEYCFDRLKYKTFASMFQFVLSLVFLFTLVSPKLWKLSGRLFKKNNEYIQSLTFCGLKMLLELVFDLPFEVYSDFVVEEKHGFNKKTSKLFVKDLCLNLLLQVVIGAPVLCVLIFLVNWGGELFYFYVFGFIIVFYFLMIVIYPELIAPLFNKFEPLQNKELKEQIENLAKNLNFPLREIKQMDGSKRSTHSNAYFYGLWKFKKIVVFDTILKFDNNQVLAVVSHELGHWKHKHMPKMLSLAFANLFGTFYLFKRFKDDKNMYKSFGFSGVESFVVGISLFMYIFSLVGLLFNLLNVTLTRKHEYQADRFSVTLGLGDHLANSLLALEKDNKQMIYVDPLYSWYHNTHPVLFERTYAVYRAMEEDKKLM